MEDRKAAIVDLHTHVLPGVDDGAAGVDESVEMLRAAHSSGTRIVVATPHMFHPSIPSRTADEIRRRFESFRQGLFAQAHKRGCGFIEALELLLGAENFWGPDFLEALPSREILSINGTRHLLVEFHPAVSAREMTRSTQILISEGWVPLLAHVERYEAIRSDPGVAQGLREHGALLQINARSLQGRFWSTTRRFVFRLLDEDLVSVIASDAHGTTQRSASLSAALKALAGRFSQQQIRAWTVDRPSWIIGANSP